MTKKVEEDKLKLCEEEESRRRTIFAGTVNTLMRINLEVTAALLAGCLLTLLVIAITLVPVIRAFDYSSCRGDDEHNKATTTNNVYFVKHEDRRWTMDELCWIEIAARRYPQFNFFMINLRKKSGDDSMDDIFFEELFGNDISIRSEYKTDSTLMEIPNIRNVDVSIAKFFAGSILQNYILTNSTNEEIELAAKFHVIWNSPGISLEPKNIGQLESILHFFDDQIDTSATVQIDGDLQAASVPCQSFIGLIIGELMREFADRKAIVKRAVSNFCPRQSNCAGVRIIEGKTANAVELAECPIARSYRID